MRGPHFASMQFHAESVLTQDGVRIVGDTLKGLLRQARTLNGRSVTAEP